MSRSSTSHTLNPNLTPLLDLVLQLITFFMMLVHFGNQIEGETRAVRLPLAPAALPGADLALDRLAAAIDARGNLLADGRVYEGEDASAWWKRQAEARRAGLELIQTAPAAEPTRPETPTLRLQFPAPTPDPGGELPTVVVLRADREASFGAVRKTLAEAQSLGFANFSLVVLNREEP
ncbi:ExbD/TolR family protein [Planctomyces sp. SH-PL62]|uniref:ExbD/TolR family protein n=1 Tax=Planctomyces sp. SH-PL62 TaxID=1636152 RepID=UPI00078EAA38|nr:biopolymer transporter ExbD [Planctomyces sp. SH-PL62]AMV40350.1 Biopolymer transport protein ExbD/TolR [Planctomyces sp. SH-PL62]